MLDDENKKPGKFLNKDDLETLKKTEQPVEKVLGMVNICIYGLMTIACLFLLTWLVFR